MSKLRMSVREKEIRDHMTKRIRSWWTPEEYPDAAIAQMVDELMQDVGFVLKEAGARLNKPEYLLMRSRYMREYRDRRKAEEAVATAEGREVGRITASSLGMRVTGSAG